MRSSVIHIALLLLCCWGTQQLQAQTGPSQLRAQTDVEAKVEAEINKYRMLMLGRQWWTLPTDREEWRLWDGRYERYYFDSLYYAGRSRLLKPGTGVYHKQQEEILNKQNLTVMGWHPYWQYEAYRYYNFKLLTHLAYYAYEVNPLTGGYANFEAIYDFKNTDLIDAAHWDTCKVLLTVSSQGWENNDVFFGTGYPVAQENLIDSLVSILAQTGADGVDLNFEEVPVEYKDRFLEFVRELSYNLRESDNNYTVSMSVPLRDPENIYDLGHLAPWVDLFVVQGFNFHLTKTKLAKAPLAPLYSQRTETKGTHFIYNLKTNLYELLRVGSQYHISTIHLLHSEDFVERLVDSLDYYVQRARLDLEALEYNAYNVTHTLEIIAATESLLMNPSIIRMLSQTNCDADIVRDYPAAEPVNFFLFSPDWDTLYIKEKDFFQGNLSVASGLDTMETDIRSVVEEYMAELGEKHRSSLILGLPYHGAIWWDEDEQRVGDERFISYISYNQVRQMVATGLVELVYDKARHSMMASVMDTLVLRDTTYLSDELMEITIDSVLPGFKIYFDNSTSLSEKFDFAMERGMGGVAIWALGFDHGYHELWQTLEEGFADRWYWNSERMAFEKHSIAKSNKISYTIQYNLKRNSNVILATVFLIAIFMAFGFSISLLDWKVRDALFYSGAFRLFYLTLFTVLVLMFGSYVGLFRNWTVALLSGILLGLTLTWVATIMVKRQQAKLP